MKAWIELEIDDGWLEQRVADYNAEADAEGDARTTAERYVRVVLQEAVAEDALPCALWTWKFDARVLLEGRPERVGS